MIDEFTAARQGARELCERVRLLQNRARHAREQGRAAWVACERLILPTARTEARTGPRQSRGHASPTRTG